MPGRPSPNSHRPRAHARAAFDPWRDAGSALVVIDEAPLKRAAWAELHTVRKRQEKAARDLHRHEEVDQPAYETWLHRTFPTFITRLRELHQEVFAKGQRVEAVQAEAFFSGRSARKIWREQQAAAAKPTADDPGHDRESREDRAHRGPPDNDYGDDDFFNDEAETGRGSQRRSARERDEWSGPRPGTEARDLYRRLVQRIHPDRGGAWTPARQRLWHEVQQAWAAGDADWLARLEVEWEAVHDVLTPTSPLSRLRSAIAEFHAARRDLERKLRAYRGSPPWRFTLTERKRAELHHRTARNFEHDLAFLQRQLDHLDAVIASWEEAPRPRRRARSHAPDFRFFE